MEIMLRKNLLNCLRMIELFLQKILNSGEGYAAKMRTALLLQP